MDIRLIFLNYLSRVITDGGTQEATRAYDWMCRFRHVGGSPRKIRVVINPEVPWRGPQGPQSRGRHAAKKSL